MNDIREKIIESATYCFIRYGYHKTTLENIGKNVGLKKNSLYHYFKNKEDIFFAVIDTELEKVTREYKAEVEAMKGIKNKILGFIKLKLVKCKTDTVLSTVLGEVTNPGHPLYSKMVNVFFQNEINFIESILTEAFKNNEIIESDFKFIAESIFLAFDAIKQQEMMMMSNNLNRNLSGTKDKYILFIVESLLDSIIVK